jgi:predicted dehydrogenase
MNRKQRGVTRRRLLQTTGAASAAALGFPLVFSSRVFGANERVSVVAVGAGGKGEVDVGGAASAGANIAALCDVDEARAAATYKAFPQARRYHDFRQMMEKEQKSIDGVIISAPDHVHAPAALMAMRLGKHVYCQKPLTHTVHEARLLTKVAREKKVATQMGNQGHSHPDTRRLVELIRYGVLGEVREAHVWTDRPIWPQGIGRPKDEPPVPPGLDWDLWLGPAPKRPYHPAYVPFKWRGFWDFGTGALGDMACHCMDLFFFALEPPPPKTVTALSSGVNEETAPSTSIIEYDFPAKSGQPAMKMTWYDGGMRPPRGLVKGRKLEPNGVILVGSEDTLYVPSYWGAGEFLSGAKMEDFKDVPQSVPRAPKEFEEGHYAEWVNACKGGKDRPMSNFDYSGPMTEAVLLGNVALRAGGKIEWDAEKLKVTNNDDANRFVRKEYRKGWELDASA